MGKYQKRRKINLKELEHSATNYGAGISLIELKRMCDDTLFKFENHISLCDKEKQPIKTLQGIYRNIFKQVSNLKNFG